MLWADLIPYTKYNLVKIHVWNGFNITKRDSLYPGNPLTNYFIDPGKWHFNWQRNTHDVNY